jgi:phosphonate transport system substrate-binding protein
MKRVAAACSVLLGFLVLCAARAGADDTLTIGMIPDAGATQVAVDQKAPLRDYLASAIGSPVKLVIPTNYNATIEGMGNGSIDVAYFGALSYVKAHQRYGVVPLVQRDIDRQFHSLFITQAGSGIKSLSDLKGKRFAFGDINSTSGHLMPYLAMKNAGLDVDKDLQSFRYTGSHPATAEAVASAAADAGALDETVFKSMIDGGKLDKTKVVVFYTTPAFVDYVWAARKDLDAKMQEKIVKAFTRLERGRDDKVLEILRGEHFVPVDDAAYKEIRSTAAALGLF